MINLNPHRCGAPGAVGHDIERNVPLQALRIGARLAGPREEARHSFSTPNGERTMVEFIVGCISGGFIGALLAGAGAALYVTRNYACPVQPDSAE